MKYTQKTALTGAIMTALLAFSYGAQAATATATVNVTATVVANTCTPQWSGAQALDVGRASMTDFTGTDAVGASNTLDLKLINCGADTTKVKVTADGTPDNGNGDLFANTESGGATGVAFALFGGDDQNTQLKPKNASNVEYAVDSGSKTVDMIFRADLKQLSETPPTSGKVTSAITLTMTYE